MRGRDAALLLGLWLIVAPAAAYTPGSGSLYSDDFEGALDPGWEQGNGLGSPSPWLQVLDGADEAFQADGNGPFGSSPTRHWAAHHVHPVSATSFALAVELRCERGNGYHFFIDVKQRAPELRAYRLRVEPDGTLTLWRTEAGAFVQVAATAPNVIPFDDKRWLRLAIEEDAGGSPWVRVRVWGGGATAEPVSGWTLEFLDTNDTLERVHRIEIEADGPRGVLTWIDDLDLWGDEGTGVASSVEQIYIGELSHLDIGFTEPPDDIETFAKTHLDSVLTNLNADPEYRWTIEVSWFLDKWWDRSTESERQNMIAALNEGRLKLAAGYGDQTTTMLGHEELTRNVYWARRFSREHGTPHPRLWVQDDVPGASFAVPEILARSGIEYYLGGMNTGFGGRLTEPGMGDRPFWWVGPDGSKVLSWITFDSYAEAFQYGFSFFDNLADMYEKLGAKLPEMEEAGYDYPELLLLRGFDNHYQGFHARNLVNQWNATYSTPVFHLLSPEEFLDMMRQKYGDASFPSYSGDFGAAWARSRSGAPHGHQRIRQAHRDARSAENLLGAASRIGDGNVPTDDLRELYELMLTSDEHTGAGGWPGYFTPEEMDRNNQIHLGYATDARNLALDLRDRGVDMLIADLPAEGDAVVAVNPLGRARDGWVRIALPTALYNTTFRLVDRGTGAEVAFQRFAADESILFRAEAVPAVGYRVFDLLPGTPSAGSPPLVVGSSTLENDHYVVTLDASDGSVASIQEKATGRELVDTSSAYDFNELASNTKAQYDAQNPPSADPPSSATLTVESSGPLLGEIKVVRSGNPHVETRYRLYAGEDRIEIHNVLDRDQAPYVPQNTAVRAYMVTMPFDIHDFEIRSETTTRFLDPVGDSFARSSVFDYHNAEHTLALHDANGGVFYAVDATGAHHLENLSSLNSPAYSTTDALVLSRLYDRSDEYEFSGGTVGSYVVEPGTPPLLPFTHHIRGTPATFDPLAASRFGFEALTPLEARLLTRRPGNLPDGAAALLEVDAAAVLPYTVKPPEVGSGLVVRAQELAGQAVTARFDSDVLSFSAPELIEQDEDGGTPLALDGNAVLLDFQPYETLTFRVQAQENWAPIQLSVDKDVPGGAVLLDWSGGVGPWTLERAESAPFDVNPVVLVDEQPSTSHSDPTLQDGVTTYYLVR